MLILVYDNPPLVIIVGLLGIAGLPVLAFNKLNVNKEI